MIKISKNSLSKKLAILKEGIVHIDKLKPQELLDFLKAWNLDQAKFHISEKMDGNYMALGLENDEFYLRSKNKVFRSADEVPNIFFMSDFKKYFSMLESLPWKKIIDNIAEKYNINYNGQFEIEGEAIPSFDHNIVLYDEAKIGDGVFVLFNTKTSFGKSKEGRILDPEMWKELTNEINKYSKIKFFSVPEVSLSDLEFDNDIIVDLEKIIEKHGNFLSKPARKPAAKELKNKLLTKIAELGKSAKSQALMQNVQSKFGSEVEGVVVSTPKGKLVKIVDTEKFTERKKNNWHFINKLIDAEREFKKTIKEDPEKLLQALKRWEELVNEIEKDFVENSKKFITIEKKFSDTRDGIDFAFGMIEKMLDMLDSGLSQEEVVNKFFNREVIPESNLENINEGGNIFGNVTSAVPKFLLHPTIKNALKLSDFSNLKYEIVGNKNKDFFNDIDIAVDYKDLAKKINAEDETEIDNFWIALKDYLQRSNATDSSVLKGLKQFHLLVPLVDSSGEHINAFDINGNRLEEKGMVQVDVFVGNLDWMKKVTSGAPEESAYKAVYRNLLLASIAATVKWRTELNSEDEYYRYTISFRDGLKKQKYKLLPPSGRRKKPKRVKLEEETVTKDPNQLSKILFGGNVTWNNISSYEKLIEQLKSGSFKFKKYLPKILEDYKSNLTRNKLKVPKDL